MFQPFRTKFTGGGINREKSIKTIVMVSQKQIRWLSKNFVPQGVVVFKDAGIHIVCQGLEKPPQRRGADFLRRHQLCQNSIKHTAHRTGNDNGVETLTTA